MARTEVADFISAAFAELLRAGGADHNSYGALSTSELESDVKDAQYRRIKFLGNQVPEVLYLHNDGFIVRFECENEYYLALKIEGLTETEKNKVSHYLGGLGLSEHPTEECFFLFLRLHLKSLYKANMERREMQAARDVLDISNYGSYKGHDIFDLVGYHEKIQIYKISPDSIFSSGDIWYMASSIASGLSTHRSVLIGDDLAQQIFAITDCAHGVAENAYTALTSIHWKYTFFELYKCLESLFFLPWGMAAKSELGLNLTALDSHRAVMKVTSFREKEKESIVRLFELLDDSVVVAALASQVLAFSSVPPSVDGDYTISKQSIGRAIYKIRNTLVHQEDYEDRVPLDLESERWDKLIEVICLSIRDLYGRYSHELIVGPSVA